MLENNKDIMENIILTFQENSILIFGSLSGVLAIITGLLFYINNSQSDEITALKNTHEKLMRSFNELDDQAKLIVKTDLELNRTQEELDRRLSGINTLQKASRQISMTLDQQEVFDKLDQKFVAELGFSKLLMLTYDKEKQLQTRVNIGFEEDRITIITDTLEKNDHLKNALKEGHTFSSQNTTQETKSRIVDLFEVEHFILTPILTQQGINGVIFVGNKYATSGVTEGDEELIAVLASQIGQSLEIATLFEQVYNSRQELEYKVRDRTSQLENALKEVSQISKKKSEFISAVSHELRTPLTSVKGYAALLMTGKVGDVPDAVKERLGKINTHSDNLVQMINELLDISRIESGNQELHIKEYEIKSFVDNTHDLLMPQLKDKKVNFKSKLPEDLQQVFVDSHQAERIFINLVSNAIKFTPEDGTITISAKNNTDEDFVTVSVSDTGIGIPEDALQKLFDEFYRVDNDINMKVKGTGLGLALCKNIVEIHKGRIWVTSKVGLGTTFNFTLPCFDPRDKKEDIEIIEE